MNLPARQSLNVIDARTSPASEEARVLQIVRETGTSVQLAQVATYIAVRSHKAEIGMFLVFVVVFALAIRDLRRLSRMLRRKLAP